MRTIDYKVGMKLWFQPNGYSRSDGPGHYLVVTKVGRKWVSLGDSDRPQWSDRYRVEVGEVAVDGNNYSSPGNVWATKEECEKASLLSKEWSEFARKLTYQSVPDGLTIEALQQVKTLLGISS
jgi:hypothetical protein